MGYLESLKERIRGLDTAHSPLEQRVVMREGEGVSPSTVEAHHSLEQSLQEIRHKLHKTLLQLFRISTTPLDDWHPLLNNSIRVPADSNWSRLPDEQVTFILTFMSQVYLTLTSIYDADAIFTLDLNNSMLCYNGNKLGTLQVEGDKTEFAISCGLVHYSLDSTVCQNDGEHHHGTRLSGTKRDQLHP